MYLVLGLILIKVLIFAWGYRALSMAIDLQDPRREARG